MGEKSITTLRTQCLNLLAVGGESRSPIAQTRNVGAVAFSRTGDPATGDFGDAR